MAIAPDYLSTAVQAILGPAHSSLVPTVLHLGWLDESGGLIAMAGASVRHSAFGPTSSGVQNIEALFCGIAGDDWEIAAVGLFADADGETLMVSAELPETVAPAPGETLTFDVGDLTFGYGIGEGSSA